eukprot:tig00021612_g22858.t1
MADDESESLAEHEHDDNDTSVHMRKLDTSQAGLQPIPSSRGSASSSRAQSARRSTAMAKSSSKFDLKKSKEAAFKSLQGIPFYQIPGNFKRFKDSELLDRFLRNAHGYFTRLFEIEAFRERLAKNPANAAGLEREVAARQAEMEGHLKEMAGIYASIILAQSNFEKTQQERLFFETLFDFANRVLYTCFKDKKQWIVIENEMGRIFRSASFNLSARKNAEQAQKIKGHTLTSRELYRLRHEGDPVQNSRVLAQLYPRRSGTSIHAAIAARSPIISTLLPTPKEKLARTIARLQQGAGGAGTLRLQAAGPGSSLGRSAAGSPAPEEEAREPGSPALLPPPSPEARATLPPIHR